MACAEVATVKAKAVTATNLIIGFSIFPFDEKDAPTASHGWDASARLLGAPAGREKTGMSRPHHTFCGWEVSSARVTASICRRPIDSSVFERCAWMKTIDLPVLRSDPRTRSSS